MKTQEIILFCMAMLCFSCPAYMRALAKTSPTVHLQEGIQNKAAEKHLGHSNIAGIRITHQMKYDHGVGSRGVSGGHAAGSSGNGNGGGSSSSDTNGGAALIPVYAAGAANKNPNNHHSAANSNWSHARCLTISVIILAYVQVTLREVI